MWTQLVTTKTVVGTARGRVHVDSTSDNKDSSRDLVTTKTVVGTARGRVRVDSTWDSKDSSRDSQG